MIEIKEGSFFSEQSVRVLYDDVLARCIVEFRQALGLLERSGLSEADVYACEMRRGLHNLEAELARRELSIDFPPAAHLTLHESSL